MSKKIRFLTGNQDKLVEARSILGSDVEQLDIDLTEIQHIDPKVVIESKLTEAQRQHDGSFIVEDTSLFLDCLGGLPGPLIKWFMKTIGNEGLANLAEKLGNNNAEAKTIIGFTQEGSDPQFFEGAIKGKIVSPRGEHGFGWDPIFQPDGYTKTFAELTSDEKNSLSMRKLALQNLKEYLETKN